VQILLALIIGAVIGLGIHYQLRNSVTRGVVLGPIIGAFSAGLAWMILTWAGVGIDTPWPWLAALVVPIVVTYPVLIVLTRVRLSHDAKQRAQLRIG
jgi:uncharacterized membrane protein YeaQ/YmgE (transglycosylase-associated protein family)